MFIFDLHVVMEFSDVSLMVNRDWDRLYLKSIFDVEFDDFSHLWGNSISDMELVNAVEEIERYSPIVEDISMDNNEL